MRTKRGVSPTYAFKCDDGQWYSTGFENPAVAKGDVVDFEFENTKYGNQVKFESLKITRGSTTGVPTTSGSSPSARSYGNRSGSAGTYGGVQKVFPIPLLHGDRSIVRQNALTNARELYVTTLDVAEPSTTDRTKMAEEIIRIARIFESYSAGDVERMATEKGDK